MTEILFVKTSSLGDVVHMMPAVTDVARALPQARLSWIVEEPFAPLARLHPSVAEVIPVATRRWRKQMFASQTWHEIAAFRAALRTRTYDAVIDTQGLIRSALIARAARGVTHGYDASSIREPLASRFYARMYPIAKQQHAVTRNRMLTALALGYALPPTLDYGLARPQSEASRHAILLHGASRRAKEWPEDRWIAVGRALAERSLSVMLPAGSDDELARSERLRQAIPNSHELNRQPLDHLAALISTAAIVIGVDTGLLHLAAAYQTPIVALFSATDPRLTGPFGNGLMATIGGTSGPPSTDDALAAVHRILG